MTAVARIAGGVAVVGAWIGALTPLATPRGPVEAGRLRAGDIVQTCGGPARVARAARGLVTADAAADRAAPVLLRAPYYAARCDLLVSPDQPVILRGAVVEDLFGEEEVQAAARLLVDGRTALAVADGMLADAVSLMLDRAGSVVADGCGLAVASAAGDRLRALRDYEVAAFVTHRWQGSLGRVA